MTQTEISESLNIMWEYATLMDRKPVAYALGQAEFRTVNKLMDFTRPVLFRGIPVRVTKEASAIKLMSVKA
jgi:hypothetical protein